MVRVWFQTLPPSPQSVTDVYFYKINKNELLEKRKILKPGDKNTSPNFLLLGSTDNVKLLKKKKKKSV